MKPGLNRIAGRNNNKIDLNPEGSIEMSSINSAIIINSTASSVPVTQTTPPTTTVIIPKTIYVVPSTLELATDVIPIFFPTGSKPSGSTVNTGVTQSILEEEQFLPETENLEFVPSYQNFVITPAEFNELNSAIIKSENEENTVSTSTSSGCKFNDIKPCTTKQTGKPEQLTNGLYSPLPKGLFTQASTYPNHGKEFTKNGSRFTTAIDLGTKGVECVPLYAISSGKVTFGGSTGNYCNKDGGMSLHLITKIGGVRYDIIYAHLNERVITNGATVTAGQLLGYSGNSGHSSTPHLHLEIQADQYGNKYAGTYDKVQTSLYELLNRDSRFKATL